MKRWWKALNASMSEPVSWWELAAVLALSILAQTLVHSYFGDAPAQLERRIEAVEQAR